MIAIHPPEDKEAAYGRDGDDDAAAAFPEGGRDAWLAVLGCWCGLLAPMGWLNTMAVLQARVSTEELAGWSEASTGWIFGTYAFLMFSAGVVVGPIFDANNVKALIIPGSVGMVLTPFLLSMCKEFWHFFMTFSILGGLSSSLLFTPCIATVGQWFCKRRALATGITCTSGGIGGILFPLVVLYGTAPFGFPWALRVIGLISTLSSLTACALVRKRQSRRRHYQPHTHHHHHLSSPTTANNNSSSSSTVAIDFRALLDTRYALTTLAVLLAESAVFVPYTYISSYALHVGFDTQLAFLLNVLLNVGAIPGRAIPGFVADRFGAFNILGVTTLMCATLILAWWYMAAAETAAGVLVSFALLFGFWSGATIALTPVCVSRVCRIEDYGKRNGTTYLIASFGVLVGAPIAGAMIRKNDEGGATAAAAAAAGGKVGGAGGGGGAFESIILFSGLLYAACTVTLYFARGVAAGWGPKVLF